MRIVQILPGIDACLLCDYDLTYFTAINELEKTIEVKSIAQQSNNEVLVTIEKILEKHIPKSGKKKITEVIIVNDLFIIPREVAAGFIYQDLPTLLSAYKIMAAEKLKAYKISTVKTRLEFKLSHGIDFLVGDASLHFAEERFSLFVALQQYNKNKYILKEN